MKRLTLIATVLLASCFWAVLHAAGVESSSSKRFAPAIVGQNAGKPPVDLRDKINALSSANPLERASAACTIGQMGPRAAAAIPYLIQMLGDDTPITTAFDCGERESWRGNNVATSLGKVAAEALAAIGEASVEPLIGALKARDSKVRANAAWALGIIKDPRTVEPLIAATRDEDWHVRANAAWGLGLKKDRNVVEPLVSVLRDREWQVREKAAWALGLT